MAAGELKELVRQITVRQRRCKRCKQPVIVSILQSGEWQRNSRARYCSSACYKAGTLKGYRERRKVREAAALEQAEAKAVEVISRRPAPRLADDPRAP